MANVNVKELKTTELITYARSLGIQTHGMNRQEIEDEVAVATKPIVPTKDDNPRLDYMENVLKEMTTVINQIQADLKKVQIATGLAEPPKEKKDA